VKHRKTRVAVEILMPIAAALNFTALQGKIVCECLYCHSCRKKRGKATINISHLPHGVYIVRVGKLATKFVK
jgi:hypothetical protein